MEQITSIYEAVPLIEAGGRAVCVVGTNTSAGSGGFSMRRTEEFHIETADGTKVSINRNVVAGLKRRKIPITETGDASALADVMQGLHDGDDAAVTAARDRALVQEKGWPMRSLMGDGYAMVRPTFTDEQLVRRVEDVWCSKDDVGMLIKITDVNADYVWGRLMASQPTVPAILYTHVDFLSMYYPYARRLGGPA